MEQDKVLNKLLDFIKWLVQDSDRQEVKKIIGNELYNRLYISGDLIEDIKHVRAELETQYKDIEHTKGYLEIIIGEAIKKGKEKSGGPSHYYYGYELPEGDRRKIEGISKGLIYQNVFQARNLITEINANFNNRQYGIKEKQVELDRIIDKIKKNKWKKYPIKGLKGVVIALAFCGVWCVWSYLQKIGG